MVVEISTAIVISLVSLACSVYFSTRNNKRADIKDVEERVRNDTLINAKLDDISAATRDIRYDVSEMKKSINSHSEKIVAIEQSVKSAHKRIDTIEVGIFDKKPRNASAETGE